MRTYGITLEQYEELLAKQDYKCPVCLKHCDEFDRFLAVDHNHKTGEIRGLLCNHCNHRVVGRAVDGDKFKRAGDYLNNGTGWFIPAPTKKRRTRASRKKIES